MTLRLMDSLMGAQLGYTPASWSTPRVWLCAGLSPKKFNCVDPGIGEVKSIDIRSKQCRTMFEFPQLYSIREMISLRGNSSEIESIAMLILSKFTQKFLEIWVLESINDASFKVKGRSPRIACPESKLKGRMVELKSGLGVILEDPSILHIWRVGDAAILDFPIPDCNYETSGMCVMENVLGREEVLALAFWQHNSIGLFAIEMSGLVLVRQKELEFSPYGLLWIASKRTLLICNNLENKEEMYALRMMECDFTSYNVTLDLKRSIEVLSWCVLPENNGNEKTIAIFDCKSYAVMIFEMA